ncbi:MAG: putative phosphoprotein phosphatase [Streblomastix strix]|uniref:Putative phosphoprotein phosphatase n=1 Tax=Streblomastix strix TaxID=222440 RepID=A0A5J4WT31_9EUKA|nr:MAG: putative phosphoprotein phosphatase [Streblomastix strix]
MIYLIILAAVFQESFCLEQTDANFIILHTNDIHGWINGHRHIPVLDADIADYYNFVQHAKELLTNHTVLAFDSGDQTQGTGLSDYTKTSGEFIFEMLEKVPIDGFTIGNHEMYNNSCIDNIADKVQYAMKGRYITSNSHHIDPNKKLGEKYRIIKVNNFGSILVFGFIYSMTVFNDHANVTSVPDAIKEEWLKDILINNQQLIDDEYPLKLIILLIHNDPVDSETDLIVNKIREYRPDLPILVLGGHSHYEKIVMKQDMNQSHQNVEDVRIESFCYFQEFGLLQFSVSIEKESILKNNTKIDQMKQNILKSPYKIFNPQKNMNSDSNYIINSMQIDFIHTQVQYMQQILKQLSKQDQPTNVTDKIVWDYPDATNIRNQIQNKVKELKLDEIIGCSDKTYGFDSTDKINLYDLLVNKIYPKVKPFGREKENSSYSNPSNGKNVSTAYIYNPQSLRAPLYQGNVTLDDFVKVDPSFNTFCAFRGVTGQDMRQLMSTLFDPAFKNMNYEVSFGDYYKVTDDAQQLFSNKDMDEQYEYDIITESYDCPPISYIFQI